VRLYELNVRQHFVHNGKLALKHPESTAILLQPLTWHCPKPRGPSKLSPRYNCNSGLVSPQQGIKQNTNMVLGCKACMQAATPPVLAGYNRPSATQNNKPNVRGSCKGCETLQRSTVPPNTLLDAQHQQLRPTQRDTACAKSAGAHLKTAEQYAARSACPATQNRSMQPVPQQALNKASRMIAGP
jgi:hypothetical protein